MVYGRSVLIHDHGFKTNTLNSVDTNLALSYHYRYLERFRFFFVWYGSLYPAALPPPSAPACGSDSAFTV